VSIEGKPEDLQRIDAESVIKQIGKNRPSVTRRLVLFGLGVQFHDCYQQIVLSIGREPDFLCDNDRTKWGKLIFGKKCISPTELGIWGKETTVVIAVRKYEGIYRQLLKLGLTDIFVACFDRGFDYVHSIKELGDEQVAGSDEPYHSPVKGKWTLITGASRGAGRQIALEMAKLGSHIIAHSRSVSHVKGIVGICSSLGVEAIPIAAELGNPVEVEIMLSNLTRVAPRIDIIFNNAAVSPAWPSGFWSAPSDDYIRTYMINTIAPISICRNLIPPMIERGFGRIVNISSSIQKRPGEMAYACSKAALDKFVHDLVPSLQGTGVMLTLVDPGWLRTDMGGSNAPCSVESVIPGALLGALLDGDINGRWFNAQDYSGLSLPAAIKKAKFYYSQKD
jgi:3-oxoacyl-[acyl-carrier protein] reductase